MDDKYLDLAVKLESVDSRCKSNTRRIENLEINMKETNNMQITLIKLANGVETMGNQLMSVKEDIQDVKTGQRELSDKVTVLENKPAQETKKKWDNITDKLLWLFIAGVAGFLFAQMFPTIF
ncbi:hypothetical protein [Lachnoclostridium sp.]|uniref:hypothetical protein n=1 Tax=Lachnoclostridium sp. TaxID=2028282 RepID=UPI0028A09463|nr:hypothetical protein [Lachnoclostridium sp.]